MSRRQKWRKTHPRSLPHRRRRIFLSLWIGGARRNRVEKIVKTGEVSRLISRPSVYAFVPTVIVAAFHSQPSPSPSGGESDREFKRGWPSFSFSLSFSLFFSFSSPSIARNHSEVSPSTKDVSTGPERVSSKNRNRKRFSPIFTEFDAPARVLVNRILSLRKDTESKNWCNNWFSSAKIIE